ncbi:MAG: hypothetical protein IT435_08235 [Phycisphaerales bacterium]|nr:hypothetical protein [Phycisphaerales bacterium]
MSHRWMPTVSLAALLIAAGSLTTHTNLANAQPAAKADDAAKGKDTLIFRNGRTMVGKIVSETPTKIRFKGEVNGIALDTEYDKSEILKIVKGAPVDPKADDKTPAPTPTPSPTNPVAAAETTPEDPTGKKRVYVMDLKGRFGRDISETPMRESLKDAQKQRADIIVISLDAEWQGSGDSEGSGDDASAFDQLFRAEKIGPIFSDEIELWPKKPEVVVWVKKAMGGAAFLPFYCKQIYFSSEGRMGGIGYLRQLMEGVGDAVVREKQWSLRLAHARGVANKQGYAFEVINAMTVTEYILSAKIEGGEVKYFERMPEGPDEILLTDDGKESNIDSTKLLIAGEGNDVLTLSPKLARDLNVSKGTVDSLEDLLTEMGHPRDWAEIKESKSKQIQERWKKDFESALRDLRTRLPQKLSEIQGGGTFQERTKARGQRKVVLREMQALYRKFAEIFGEEQAAAQIADLDTQIELIDQEQQRDAQEQKRR